jgi:CBS domain-containing protein
MKLKDLLRQKGSKIITAKANEDILAAINRMVENQVGALVVVNENNLPVGMFTERDVLRLAAENNNALADKHVKDGMTTDIVVAVPEDDTSSCLALMTERRIRHLPVIDGGKMVGLISIGDIVKAEYANAEFEIHHLRDYIMGKF